MIIRKPVRILSVINEDILAAFGMIQIIIGRFICWIICVRSSHEPGRSLLERISSLAWLYQVNLLPLWGSLQFLVGGGHSCKRLGTELLAGQLRVIILEDYVFNFLVIQVKCLFFLAPHRCWLILGGLETILSAELWVTLCPRFQVLGPERLLAWIFLGHDSISVLHSPRLLSGEGLQILTRNSTLLRSGNWMVHKSG